MNLATANTHYWVAIACLSLAIIDSVVGLRGLAVLNLVVGILNAICWHIKQATSS